MSEEDLPERIREHQKKVLRDCREHFDTLESSWSKFHGWNLLREVDRQRAEIARLREALEHYANTENWTSSVTDEADPDNELVGEFADVYLPDQHGYDRARKTLEEGE